VVVGSIRGPRRQNGNSGEWRVRDAGPGGIELDCSRVQGITSHRNPAQMISFTESMN
jgi:hypothetical protein